MVAFTAMGEGTTGTPLHKGSEAQTVGAVQTPYQTEKSTCVCSVCGLHAPMHGSVCVDVKSQVEQEKSWLIETNKEYTFMS